MSLELRDVTVTVPDGTTTRTLLDGVDLTVERGETLALTGPSGSGKSTLLAVAGLLRRADQGSVIIDGVSTDGLSDKLRTRLRGDRVGIVYQASNLLPSLTAREQVEVVAHIAGRLDKEARGRAEEMLVRVGLQDRLDARPAELSGGERQRVGIARALMGEPALILADEPTASLDPERGEEVMRLLLDEARRIDAATLVVTHEEELAAGADRRVHLVHGALAPLPGESVAG
jgi:putative ABC transport system ATP-binding protein